MEMSGQFHAFVSFPRGETCPSTHFKGGWVCPGVGLVVKEAGKVSCTCRISTPTGHSAHHLVPIIIGLPHIFMSSIRLLYPFFSHSFSHSLLTCFSILFVLPYFYLPLLSLLSLVFTFFHQLFHQEWCLLGFYKSHTA
jgi:hypothetical protein